MNTTRFLESVGGTVPGVPALAEDRSAGIREMKAGGGEGSDKRHGRFDSNIHRGHRRCPSPFEAMVTAETGKPAGRPSKRLETLREPITELHNAKASIPEILIELQIKHNVKVGRSTLAKQLVAWDLRKRRPKWEDSKDLRRRLKHCFDGLQLTDAAARTELLKHGYDLGSGRLAILRKEMGMYKRVDKEERPLADAQIEEIMAKEYEDEEVRNMGLRQLHKYLRQKHNIIGRDRMYAISKKLDPEGPARRLAIQMKNTRASALAKQRESQRQQQEHEDVVDPALASGSTVANFESPSLYNYRYGDYQPFS